MRRVLLVVLGVLLGASRGAAQGGGLPGPIDLAAVVPVVISAPGAGASSYHTAVQVYNPNANAISGRFVLHTSSGTDAVLPFSIDASQTVFFADLPDAMERHGLGSLDVVTSATIVLSVRVYNDASGGTTGFTEDAQKPTDALAAGDSTVLVAPFDPALFRFNVGLRALDGGAAIRAILRDEAGNVRTAVSEALAGNAFRQTDAATFLGGVAPGPSDSITIEVLSGSVFVYGATADNGTGDPAIAVGRKVF